MPSPKGRMTSLAYAMQMPCCSNCGRQLRHLYEDHIDLTRKLLDDIKNRGGPSGRFVGSISGKDITDFINVYYTWKKGNKGAPPFQPGNIVARALISIRDLDETMLPFGAAAREEDGQLSMLNEPVCCLRMLHCNPLAYS